MEREPWMGDRGAASCFVCCSVQQPFYTAQALLSHLCVLPLYVCDGAVDGILCDFVFVFCVQSAVLIADIIVKKTKYVD